MRRRTKPINSLDMWKNYLKVAFRNLLRSKSFSSMNILGLAIGMASSLMILLWVAHEWSFDNFYPNQDRIYEVWNKDKWGSELTCWNTTPKIMGSVLKQEYPQIEKSTRVNWDQTLLFTVGEKRLNVSGTMVDPDFLTIFNVPFIKGKAATAFSTPNSIILTQKLAKKLFGEDDPIGKSVKIDNKDNYMVRAVIKDLPNNTRFTYEYLLPWSYLAAHGQEDSSWEDNSTQNFVLLKPHVDIDQMNADIKNITKRHIGPRGTTDVFLYPLSKGHLYSNFVNGVPAHGRIEIVRAFLLIALFILLIACINFMNLSTARSEKRAKEVGIRKTVGAMKRAIVIQFLAESLMITLMAGIVALILVQVFLQAFNTLTHKELSIAYGSPLFWMYFVGFIFITGLVAGSYPAFFLSAFRPVQILKGAYKKANALVTPRRVLVILQFTFAIILIVCTLIIEKQIKYAQDREAGYNKSNLLYVMMQGTIDKNYTLIKNDLLAQGIATTVSKTSSPLTQSWSNTWGIRWDGKSPDDKTIINVYCSDGSLIKTAGMQIIQGRDIDLVNYPSDSTAAILNEAAVKTMGFKHPLGQLVRNDSPFHVVGVIKDFIIESPYETIRPMVIFGPKYGFFNTIHIKLNPVHSTKENLASMEKVFKSYNPEYPFEYTFVDQNYAQKFGDEQTTGTLAALFAGLTIFISCLGLFGLAAYMAENRVKEIGVRKVLGASTLSITTLLSKDFITLVIIAIFIASPIAWFSMRKWLQEYPFHASIDAWVFLLAALLAILISLATVSYQAIKAALANPIKGLRSE